MHKDPVEYLIKLAEVSDNLGKFQVADTLTELITSKSFVRTAQYCGVIGYVLNQRRFLESCIRTKGASSDIDSMHSVIMGCLKDYQDKQSNYYGDSISKYASVSAERQIDELFRVGVEQHKMLPYDIAEKLIADIYSNNDIHGDISNLHNSWDIIRHAELHTHPDFAELGDMVAFTKEAGFWDTLKSVGKGLGKAWDAGRFYMQYAGVIKAARNSLNTISYNFNEIDNQMQTLANDPNLAAAMRTKKQNYAQFLSGGWKSQDFRTLYQTVQQIGQAIPGNPQVETLLTDLQTIQENVSILNGYMQQMSEAGRVSNNPQAVKLIQNMTTFMRQLNAKPFDEGAINNLHELITQFSQVLQNKQPGMIQSPQQGADQLGAQPQPDPAAGGGGGGAPPAAPAPAGGGNAVASALQTYLLDPKNSAVTAKLSDPQVQGALDMLLGVGLPGEVNFIIQQLKHYSQPQNP